MSIELPSTELVDELRAVCRLLPLEIAGRAADEIDRLQAEAAQLREWHHGGRSNVNYTDTGVRICRGLHEKSEACEWEEYRRG